MRERVSRVTFNLRLGAVFRPLNNFPEEESGVRSPYILPHLPGMRNGITVLFRKIAR